MTVNQEDKLSMYYVLKNTCDRFQSVWSGNAVFAASYNLWGTKLPLIEQNRDAQIVETSGITEDKRLKRGLMEDRALFIINRLLSYGTVTGNAELLGSVKYSASDLKKARDIDAIGICNIVLARATANAAAIVAYGVAATMITDLQAAITAYSATLAKPKAARAQTKTATENLSRLFKEADDLLVNRLDLDIELFRVSKPDFYSQYFSSRRITSTGGGAMSVLGSVCAAGSGEPLKGVSFTFIAEEVAGMKSAAVVKPTVKLSAEKGKFRASLPENRYRVIVERMGYKKQELTIAVASGESTNLDVVLELDK